MCLCARVCLCVYMRTCAMMIYVSLVKRACCLWFYRHIPIYTYTRTHLYVYIYGPHGAASTQNQSLTAVASHALTYTPIRTHVYMYKYGPASKSVIDCRCKPHSRMYIYTYTSKYMVLHQISHRLPLQALHPIARTCKGGHGIYVARTRSSFDTMSSSSSSPSSSSSSGLPS